MRTDAPLLCPVPGIAGPVRPCKDKEGGGPIEGLKPKRSARLAPASASVSIGGETPAANPPASPLSARSAEAAAASDSRGEVGSQNVGSPRSMQLLTKRARQATPILSARVCHSPALCLRHRGGLARERSATTMHCPIRGRAVLPCVVVCTVHAGCGSNEMLQSRMSSGARYTTIQGRADTLLLLLLLKDTAGMPAVKGENRTVATPSQIMESWNHRKRGSIWKTQGRHTSTRTVHREILPGPTSTGHGVTETPANRWANLDGSHCHTHRSLPAGIALFKAVPVQWVAGTQGTHTSGTGSHQPMRSSSGSGFSRLVVARGRRAPARSITPLGCLQLPQASSLLLFRLQTWTQPRTERCIEQCSAAQPFVAGKKKQQRRLHSMG